MANLKTISVVVPCYNEAKFISKLLENMIAQDYPKDLVEIIFADGLSTDNTKAIIGTYASRYPQIKCIDNEGRYVPSALNAAIRRSTGEIIIRMDAHSIYPNNYWTVLVEKISLHKAQNVGGVWITKPGANTEMAEAIVLATSHPLGIGNAGYRLGVLSDKEVDTVPFGCFNRILFDEIGFFDEQLIRNQDDEFNGRIIKHGGKIFLIPSLEIQYFARENFTKLSKMFYQYGLFKPLVNLKLGSPATARQFAPPLLVMSFAELIAGALFDERVLKLLLLESLVYLAAILVVSVRLTRLRSVLLFVYTVICFPVIHFSYGLGYIFGLVKFAIRRQHLRNTNTTITSSR